MSDDRQETEVVEFAVTWTIDGKEFIQQAPGEQEAFRRVARMMGHHARAKVQASGYRVVRRVVRAGPWEAV